MSNSYTIEGGARALYMVEHAHRIVELAKGNNAATLIEADFKAHRVRYIHKMEDFLTALTSGLADFEDRFFDVLADGALLHDDG